MDVRELQKLNKEKIKILIRIIIILILWFVGLFILPLPKTRSHAFETLVCFVAIIALVKCYPSYHSLTNKIVSYILSQFPDWKSIETDNIDLDNDNFIPSQHIMLSTVLPTYETKEEIFFNTAFCYKDNTKSITTIDYHDQKHKKSEDNDSFYSGIITIKNSKNLNSITYFQTNNYPKKTEKHIIEEKSKLELPKINLAEAYQYNIDVYSDNKDIAGKLATVDLFSAMQNIKQQFNLNYVKAVFYNEYIIFVLRHNGRFLLEKLPFYIKIPWFKSIDYPLLEQAVNNFKTLTDLADKAPEFTKNI